MVVFSPPAGQAVRLHYTYVVGPGIPKPTAQDEDVQEVIDDWWDDPDNREFTCHEGQCETDTRLQIDGELFIALYTNDEDGHVKCRTVDPLDVQDVITHPDDRKRVLYYRVRVHQDLYDFEQGTVQPHTGPEEYVYFPDWQNTDPDRDPFTQQVAPYLAPNGGVMAAFAIGRQGLRGISPFVASNVWISQHKKFMENRAIITEALAKIAFVKTVKGGPTVVGAQAAMEQSTLTTNLSSFERNPAPAVGSTLVKNLGVDYEQLKVDSGAANAVQDGEMLAQMLGTGLGWPTHYILMSQEAHTLATSVVMELPVLKAMIDGQTRWSDMLTRLITFALVQAAKRGRLLVPVRVVHGYEKLMWAEAAPPPNSEAELAEQEELDQTLQPATAGGQQQGGRGGKGSSPAPPGGSGSGGNNPTPNGAPASSPSGSAGMVRELEPSMLAAQVEQQQQQRDPQQAEKRARKNRGAFKIVLPPILDREVQQFVAAVVSALQAGTLTPEQGTTLIMGALGLDVATELPQWKAFIEQRNAHVQQEQQQQLEMQRQALAQAGQNGGGGAPNGGAGGAGSGNPFAAMTPPSGPSVPSVPTPPATGQTMPGMGQRPRSGGMSRNPS